FSQDDEVVADLREDVPDKLHGQRASALRIPTKRLNDRPDRSEGIDAVVTVEATVLGGEQRLDRVRRDVDERNPGAILLIVPAYFGAVLRVKNCGGVEVLLLEPFNWR